MSNPQDPDRLRVCERLTDDELRELADGLALDLARAELREREP